MGNRTVKSAKGQGCMVGYARVSTMDKNLDLQIDALQKAGVGKIFDDKASGARADRPGLAQAMDYLRAGDCLVVWKLDRLGRSLQHLVETINALQARGVEFRSLTENIDTTSPGGKLTFHIFAAVAEFARDLTRERTRAGLAAARARGRRGGRKPSLSPSDAEMVRTLMADPKVRPAEVMARFKIGKTTLYNYLKKIQ